MLKSIVFVSALAIGLSTPALANEPDAPIHWDGPYVGVDVGLGSSTLRYPVAATVHASTDTTLSGEARQTSSGVIGGGHLGYNIETGGLVLEADIMASDVKGETTLAGSASGALTGGAAIGIVSQLDYLGTVRGRVGVPLVNGRFLPYVTGGFAYGRVRTQLSGALNGTTSGSDSGVDVAAAKSFYSDQTGWVLGVGSIIDKTGAALGTAAD